jgi:hypothetical protein
MHAMKHRIKTADDITWLLAHTHAFQGGQVTDLHLRKQRLFDESTGREISAGNTITAVIRYEVAIKGPAGLYALSRVARLTMAGATEFSIFEHEGADCSELGTIHAEASAGRLRFWFDPHGELYVICDEAVLEEVSVPVLSHPRRTGMTAWTFQAQSGSLPGVDWFLGQLDRLGAPCMWRGSRVAPAHQTLRWEGRFMPEVRRSAKQPQPRSAGVFVQAHGPLDGCAFLLTIRAAHPQDSGTSRLFTALTDVIARSFTGMCVIGDQLMDGEEWLGGRGLEARDTPALRRDESGRMQPAEQPREGL